MTSLWNSDGSTNTRISKRTSGGGTQHVNIFGDVDEDATTQQLHNANQARPGTSERIKSIHHADIFKDESEEAGSKEGVKISDQRYKDMTGCNIFSEESGANQNSGKLSDFKKRSLYDTHLFDDPEKIDGENTNSFNKKHYHIKASDAKLKEAQGNDIFSPLPTPSRTQNGRTPGGNSSICFGVSDVVEGRNHVKMQQPPGGSSQIRFG